MRVLHQVLTLSGCRELLKSEPTRPSRGMVCTLILSKSGVKLGLVRGVELADPKGLLEGSGKVHKYVQLRKASDLNRPGVKGLVKAAHAAWQQRNA
jgi:hypothetical protein